MPSTVQTDRPIRIECNTQSFGRDVFFAGSTVDINGVPYLVVAHGDGWIDVARKL